jgi:hypothetical protein
MYTISSVQHPPQMLDAFHVSDQTGEICHMAGFPVTSPLTDNNFFPQRTFAKGFVTYNHRDDSQPKELVFYTLDANTAKLTESNRVDVSALNGDLQAYTSDLRFFYTMSNDVVTPGNCPDTKQNFRSYERTPDGFVQRGVLDMGDSDGCTFSHGSDVEALAGNEKWMLLDRSIDGPDSHSDFYSIFLIDPASHAAVEGQNFTDTDSGDFRWATFFVRPDSRTIVELEAGDDDIPQRLHSWRVNEFGQVSEAPGSPVVMDILEPSSYLLPTGPTNYIVGIQGMLSEWSVGADGTLIKVGEVADPTNTTQSGPGKFLQATSSGRVILRLTGTSTDQMDLVTFLHDNPPQVKKSQFEYLINAGSIILFRPQ